MEDKAADEGRCEKGCNNLQQFTFFEVRHENYSGYEFVNFYRCLDCDRLYHQTHLFDPFDRSDCIDAAPKRTKRTLEDILLLENLTEGQSLLLPMGFTLEAEGIIGLLRSHEETDKAKKIESMFLKYETVDRCLCSVYCVNDDDDDGSRSAGALVVRKDFIAALIKSAKYPGQKYKIPDMDPISEIMHQSRRSLSIRYVDSENCFQLSADTRRTWQPIVWNNSVDELAEKYLGSENEEIVEALLENRRTIERNLNDVPMRIYRRKKETGKPTNK